MRLAALVILLAATLGGDAAGGRCTKMDCDSWVALHLARPFALGPERELRITACKNGLCSSGPAIATDVACRLRGEAPVQDCQVRLLTHPTRVSVTVQFPPPRPSARDVYVLRIEHGGSVLAELNEQARYQPIYPNGPRCGPTCYHTIIGDPGPYLPNIP